MPELPEVESFRVLAENARNRKITNVFAPDSWYVKGGSQPADLMHMFTGRTIVGARRHGKLLLLDTDNDGPVLGIHFGMTGRLQVDQVFGLDQLMYSSNRINPEWQRFGVEFDDGGSMYVHDPRRLGGVEIDPDESQLGPDATAITFDELKQAFAKSSVPVKARLMDQHKIAGIGNLMADELLWRAGVEPSRASRSLRTPEIRALHETIVSTVPELIERGGCHLGDLIEHRVDGGRCPRDGAILIKSIVGGRTTYACPKHQH